MLRDTFACTHVELPSVVCAILSAVLLFPLEAIAQEECGLPPPIIDENLRGEIDGKAELLSRHLGDASISGKVDQSRREIFSKFPDADISRSTAYFQYQTCILLVRDNTLSERQKRDAWHRVREAFQKPLAGINQRGCYPGLDCPASSEVRHRSEGCYFGECPPAPPEAQRPLIPSRIFAGPNQYPPREFAAYGILAFRSRPSSYNRHRYSMICEAYATALPHASELAVPRGKQMVTVWPLNSDDSSSRINQLVDHVEDICQIAVDNYGLVIAQQALKEAELAGVDMTGTGPFLLAWSPSTDKGKQNVPVLVSDLSDVTTYEQAHKMFLDWSRKIELDPTLWRNGWDIERLRRTIQEWVDKYGPKSLAVFGLKG